MITPASIGLPTKFSTWRKGQQKAVEQVLFSKERFPILNSPTGGGKSCSSMAIAMLEEDEQIAYLTATKALQDQVLEDFQSTGLTDIRGRANYICNIDERKTAADAICTAGAWCPRIREGGCDYYDQRKDAAAARLVLSNYAFWLHDEESASLGKRSILILDEAHQAVSQIEKFAAVEMMQHELGLFQISKPEKDGQERWRLNALTRLEMWIERNKPQPGQRVDRDQVKILKLAKDLQRKFVKLCRLSEQEWLFSAIGRTKWRWDLLDPGALAEPLLFRGAKKIVLVSATVNKKTLSLLGVNPDKSGRVIEQSSTFPVRRRPVYYWPVARVGYTMDEQSKKYWRRAIDQIIDGRLDRKGIIHSVSYGRAVEIVRESKHAQSGIFILHTREKGLEACLQEFRGRKGAAVLVSPAVTEGLDFPMQQAEYQIIAKMPFPDMSDPLTKVRKKRDKDYIPYQVLQHVVQMTGRIVRSMEDQGETWVIDDHFGWLRSGYYHYLPRWFETAIKTLPKREPPPKALDRLVAV